MTTRVRSSHCLIPIGIIVLGLAIAVAALVAMLRGERGTGPILVPANARAVRVVQDNSPGIRVVYEVGAEFPATGFIAQVARWHQKMGWSEAAGLLFPTLEDSLGSDWDDYIDATALPQVRRREMMMEFGNAAGERVLYLLTYETPPDVEQPPLLLRVNAAHYDAEEARAMQGQLGLIDAAMLRATPLEAVEEQP